MYHFHKCPFCSQPLRVSGDFYTITLSCYSCMSGDITKYKVSSDGNIAKYKASSDTDHLVYKCEFILDKLYIQVYFKEEYTIISDLISNTLLQNSKQINRVIVLDLANIEESKEKIQKYLLLL